MKPSLGQMWQFSNLEGQVWSCYCSWFRSIVSFFLVCFSLYSVICSIKNYHYVTISLQIQQSLCTWTISIFVSKMLYMKDKGYRKSTHLSWQIPGNRNKGNRIISAKCLNKRSDCFVLMFPDSICLEYLLHVKTLTTKSLTENLRNIWFTWTFWQS